MNKRKNYIYKNILQSNKGFAISSIMYLILVLAVVLMTISLAVLSNRHLLIVKQKDKALEDIYGKQGDFVYIDPILNGSDPILGDLTPVVYKGNKWIIADNSTTWYDYEHQEWANAVILNNTAKNKVVGQSLNLENDVIAMFVWIPRYSYTINDTIGSDPNLPRAIDIKFIGTDTVDDGAATYSGNKPSEWHTHPAFTFDNQELSGIWVGKFETTGTEVDPTILPNLQSLTNQNINTQFETSKLFKTKYEISFDSHMAKNSEWGAVAYLSQSAYGKYGNSNYKEANKEVYINNSSDMYTGRSGGSPSANENSDGTCKYDDIEESGLGKGQCGGGASTTGNITGVYDMSGGAFEHVMGNLNNTTSETYDGFSSMPESKYFDEYKTEDSSTACNGICYGHALSETSGWYGGYENFVSSSNPWLGRGGYFGSSDATSIFASYYYNGSSNSNGSFRVVLVDA